MDWFHSTAISEESSIVYRKLIFNSARCSATKSISDCTERRKQQQQPNHVVDVNSVNLFKARLDRFWMDQDVKYDFMADLTGTGDRSVNVISET